MVKWAVTDRASDDRWFARNRFAVHLPRSTMRDPSTQVKKRARVTPADPLTHQSSEHPTNQNDESTLSNKPLKIHECSFIKCDVPGVTAVAASLCGNYIAVARSNGNLELREKKFSWTASSLLYAETGEQDESIMEMQFSNCNKYLCAARLNGFLYIYRVTKHGLEEHTRIDPGGRAIWDLDILRGVDQLHIALACDDGCIRFVTPDPSAIGSETFGLPQDSIHYEVRANHRFRCRMLSVCWAPVPNVEDAFVACGDSEGTLRWLKASNREVEGSGTIPGRRDAKVMLWTLQFVRNGHHVICGDSRGFATVWSSKTSTMIQEVQVEGLRGSLWSSAVIEDENHITTVLFGSASGAIGGLQIRPDSAPEEMAVPQRAVRLYNHDVRALATLPDKIVVSGSTDSRLSIFPESALRTREKVRWVLSHNSIVGQRPVQFVPRQSLILSRRDKSLEVWSISDNREYPSLRLQMNLRSLSSSVRACAMSDDCSLVGVSDAKTFHLYKIWDCVGSVHDSPSFGQITPLEISEKIRKCLGGAIDLAFSSKTIVAISKCARKVMFLESGEFRECTIKNISSSYSPLTSVVACSSRIAVADSTGNIFTLDSRECMENQKWETAHLGGKRAHRVTCMSFSKDGIKLVFALSNSSAAILTRLKDKWSDSQQIWGNWQSIATCISFLASEKTVVVAGEVFCCISKIRPESDEDKQKPENQKKAFPIYLPYEDSIMGSSSSDRGGVMIVRQPWQQSKTILPGAIPRKVYGT